MKDKREHDPGRDPLIFEITIPGDAATPARIERIDARRFRPRILETRPCSKCGAMIHILRTVNDRRSPVDAVPVLVKLVDVVEGTNLLYNAAGRNMRLDVGEVGFISHFATCPHADDFRKKKRSPTPTPPDPMPSPEEFGKRLQYMEDALHRHKGTANKGDKALIAELWRYAKRTREIYEVNRERTS